MKLNKIQKLASLLDGKMVNNQYIVNKREKGQPKFIQCTCCKKIFDLSNSDDYIGAIKQWEKFGKKCYACGEMLGTKETFPCHIK